MSWRQLHTAEEVLAAVERGERVEFTACGPGSEFTGSSPDTIDAPAQSGGWVDPSDMSFHWLCAVIKRRGRMFRARPQEAQPQLTRKYADADVRELVLSAARLLAAASACAARREPFAADAPAIIATRAALARFEVQP